MTVSTTTGRATPYAGNGVTKAFAVPFEFNDDADLKVYIDTTLKTLTTDYTVSGGDGATGTVNFIIAPPNGSTVVIYDDPPMTQAVDYTANDPFPAETHEGALDKLTRLVRRVATQVSRTLHLADSDSAVTSTELPEPEALSVIGWDADATGLANYSVNSIIGAIATVDWRTDLFSGNGSQTAFVLTRAPGVASNCDVSISGVTQRAGTDYTISNTTLTFTTAPPLGTNSISVRYGSALGSYTGTAENVSFTQDGSGAVETSVAEKLQEYISVMDFGAVGNGTTNDTSAINAALTEGAASYRPVFLPSGYTFIVTGISIPSNTRLYGAGDRSVIKLQDAANVNTLIATSKSNIHLRDFKLDGNWTGVTTTESANGIRIDDCTDVQITGLFITGASNDGISLKSQGTATTNNHILLVNNTITNCGRNGIAVLRGRHIKIANNTFRQIGLINIDLEPNTGETAEDITITGNTGDTAPWGHIAATGDGTPTMIKNVVITGNIYSNRKTQRTGTQTGSAVATSGNITLTDSAAFFSTWGIEAGDVAYRTMGGDGICGFKVVSVDSETQLTVRRMYGPAKTFNAADTYTFFGDYYGYRLQNSDYSTMTGNVCAGVKTLGGTVPNSGVGYQFEGCDYCAAAGNVAQANGGSGIRITNSNYLAITGNTINSSGGYAVESDGAGSTNCKLIGNQLTGLTGATYNVGTTHIVSPYNNAGTIDVYRATGQATTASTPAKVQFATESLDLNGWFDAVTNYRYTPLQPGRYRFSAKVSFDALASGRYARIMLYLNGANVWQERITSGANVGHSISLSADINANGSTDYFEVFYEHDDPANPSISSGDIYTRLQASYVERY